MRGYVQRRAMLEIWLFIHIMFLIGFRNRIIVLTQWAWSYLTWQRGARLITGELGADLAAPDRLAGDTDEAASDAEEERRELLARRQSTAR